MKLLLILVFIGRILLSVEPDCEDVSSSTSLGRLVNNVRQITSPENIDDLRRLGEKGRFKGKGGHKLGYMNFVNPAEKGAVVLMQGFGENYEKWMETILDLYNKGYSVYTYDQRGTGVSGRLGKGDDVIHIDKFSDYVKDLKKFVKKVVKPKEHKSMHLLGHSLGATVATAYLQKNDGVFDSAVMSSPMYSPKIGFLPGAVAWGVVSTACVFGRCKNAAIGQKKFDPEGSYEDAFAKDKATHNIESFQRYHKYKQENPEIVTSRASNGWVKKTLEGCADVRKNARKIKTPIKVFQAEDDNYVHNWAEDKVCSGAKNCEKEVFKGSYHEIFNETEDIRSRAISITDEFFTSNGQN